LIQACRGAWQAPFSRERSQIGIYPDWLKSGGQVAGKPVSRTPLYDLWGVDASVNLEISKKVKSSVFLTAEPLYLVVFARDMVTMHDK
jgi:hypothetical protein